MADKVQVKEPIWVMVCGSSLNMAGIAASLSAEPSLNVVYINPHSPTTEINLKEIHSAVIVFDLSELPAALDVSLLREMSSALLIGLEPSSDEILVLSSRLVQASSTADFIRMIQSNFKP